MKNIIRKVLSENKIHATPQELIKNLPKELKELLFKQWGAKQNPKWHPEGNSLKHILVVIKRAYHHYPDDPNMIMAALFHDLGKMDTYAINPKTQEPTAHGHEDKSTDYIEQFRNWIESFEGTNVDEIKYLVKNHMKVKPSRWEQMRDKKKEPISSHPAFNKLMNFTNKLDGGGTDIKESIRKILRENNQELMEIRKPLLNYLKTKLTNTPDYIIQDLFYKNLKGGSQEDIDNFVNEFKNVKWELKTNFPISYDIFDDRTVKKLREREGGSKNPDQVPNDEERHQKQKELILKKGLPKEPIILIKTGNKYELVEGWHRTIQLLTIFPEGYKYPNVYIGTK